MDKQIYHLRDESHPIETCYNVINWLDFIGYDAIASPDLIVLIERFYFEN
jgi:hypothetical protein